MEPDCWWCVTEGEHLGGTFSLAMRSTALVPRWRMERRWRNKETTYRKLRSSGASPAERNRSCPTTIACLFLHFFQGGVTWHPLPSNLGLEQLVFQTSLPLPPHMWSISSFSSSSHLPPSCFVVVSNGWLAEVGGAVFGGHCIQFSFLGLYFSDGYSRTN